MRAVLSRRSWSSLLSLGGSALMIGGSFGRWYSVAGVGSGTAKANGLGLYYDGSRLLSFDAGWSPIWLGVVLAVTSLGLLTRVVRLAGGVSIIVGAAALYLSVVALRRPASVFGDVFDDWPDVTISESVSVSWGLFAIAGGAVLAIFAGFVALAAGGRRGIRRLSYAGLALALGLGLGWFLATEVFALPA